MSDYTVRDEDDYAVTYDEDDPIEVRKGDLRALLDVATGSMDFVSGFLENEQVEALRKIAGVLDVDPLLVTPSNFVCLYKGHHAWRFVEGIHAGSRGPHWRCPLCQTNDYTATDPKVPPSS